MSVPEKCPRCGRDKFIEHDNGHDLCSPDVLEDCWVHYENWSCNNCGLWYSEFFEKWYKNCNSWHDENFENEYFREF